MLLFSFGIICGVILTFVGMFVFKHYNKIKTYLYNKIFKNENN
jgi:hypothetical protein